MCLIPVTICMLISLMLSLAFNTIACCHNYTHFIYFIETTVPSAETHSSDELTLALAISDNEDVVEEVPSELTPERFVSNMSTATLRQIIERCLRAKWVKPQSPAHLARQRLTDPVVSLIADMDAHEKVQDAFVEILAARHLLDDKQLSAQLSTLGIAAGLFTLSYMTGCSIENIEKTLDLVPLHRVNERQLTNIAIVAGLKMSIGNNAMGSADLEALISNDSLNDKVSSKKYFVVIPSFLIRK